MSKYPEVKTRIGQVDVLNISGDVISNIIEQYSPNSHDIDCCIQNMHQTIEQLRAENERLRGYLREIRQSCLKSDLSNDTIANIYGRCQAILKEPGNDK